MNRNDHQMIVTTFIRVMILIVMTFWVSGCGENQQDYICKQNELQACPCIGGGQSVQACTEDRQGWGQCQCTSEEDQSEGNGGTDSNGGMGSAGTDSNGGMDSAGTDSNGGMDNNSGTDNGGTDSGMEGGMEGGTNNGGMEGGTNNGGMEGGTNNAGMEGGTNNAGMEGGTNNAGTDNNSMNGRPVTIWAHTFNETLGPGSGLQPGDMETQGSQGFTDGGSWISTGGWLSKTISTVGYNTIEVEYLLTKDPVSTCELNMSIDGGSTWTNILSDNGPGGYRMNATLPTSAEGEDRVILRWTSATAWCWMNEILITALATSGVDNDMNTDDMDATGDTDTTTTNSVFHVFLLMGQSNMVGCDIITPADQVTDERVSVLGYETCPDTTRISNEWDIASPPLHNCSTGIGPGDHFAKTLAEALPEGHTMGLVPTAVSGQWIETFLQGGVHHQNILNKIQIAAGVENARFSGIIFHQGESNNGDATWLDKVQLLYNQLKAAMEIDYDIPFIAGEMLYGGNCEGHNTLVRQVPDLGSNFDYVSAEGLVMAPEDEWLVHFDHNSQVTLGRRYGEKMRVALGW